MLSDRVRWACTPNGMRLHLYLWRSWSLGLNQTDEKDVSFSVDIVSHVRDSTWFVCRCGHTVIAGSYSCGGLGGQSHTDTRLGRGGKDGAPTDTRQSSCGHGGNGIAGGGDVGRCAMAIDDSGVARATAVWQRQRWRRWRRRRWADGGVIAAIDRLLRRRTMFEATTCCRGSNARCRQRSPRR